MFLFFFNVFFLEKRIGLALLKRLLEMILFLFGFLSKSKCLVGGFSSLQRCLAGDEEI